MQHLRRLRIETGVGLIEQQHFRVVQQGARDGQALHHPARVGAHQVVAPLRQADLLQQLHDARPGVGHAVKAGEEAQVFLARQAVVEQRGVRDDSQVTPDAVGVGGHVQAADAQRRRSAG